MLQLTIMKENKYVYKESIGDKLRTIGWYAFSSAFLLGLVGGAVYFGKTVKRDLDIKNNHLKIETNVAKYNDIAKYSSRAITVTKEDSKYFVELYGLVIKHPGETPTFTSFTYAVDESFYNKANKYFDTNYVIGQNGNVIDVNNELRDDLSFFFPKAKAKWANHDVLNKLVEITKQKADSVNYIAEENKLTNKTSQSANQDLVITSITKPIINQKDKTMSFSIQTISNITTEEVQDISKIELKTYVVSKNLTTQLVVHPEIIYQEYINDKCDFKLQTEELITIKNFEYTNIQNDWGSLEMEK